MGANLCSCPALLSLLAWEDALWAALLGDPHIRLTPFHHTLGLDPSSPRSGPSSHPLWPLIFPALRRAIWSFRCIGRLNRTSTSPPLPQLRSLLLRQAQVLLRRGLTFLIHDFRSTNLSLQTPFADVLPHLCVSWPCIDLLVAPHPLQPLAFVFSPTFFD